MQITYKVYIMTPHAHLERKKEMNNKEYYMK